MDEQAATSDPYVDVEEEGEDGAVERQDVKEEEEEEQPWGDEWGWEHEGWDGSHGTWNWDDSETTVKAEPVGETSSSSKGDKSWGGNWWSKSWSNNDEKSWHANDGKSWYSKDDKSWHAKQEWSQRHPPKQEYGKGYQSRGRPVGHGYYSKGKYVDSWGQEKEIQQGRTRSRTRGGVLARREQQIDKALDVASKLSSVVETLVVKK
eukprot:symbB.v1.2.010655.t1/scaffold698.1/size172485/4